MTRPTIFIALLSLIAGVAQAQAPAVLSESPVIFTVNGDTVHQAEVEQMMSNMSRVLSQRGQEIDQEQLQQAALQEIVDMKLLAQEARRREIAVDPAEVASTLKSLEERAGGREQLEAELAKNGLTVEKVEAGILEGAQIRQLIETQLRAGIEVSDEEIATFYSENPDRFQTGEQVHARHIIRTVEQGASDELKAAARDQAVKARERALAGEDFATLAQELSQGPSAEKGGDLGFFTAAQMVPPFAEAAFALEVGAISEVVETRFGFHVIKVEEKREAGVEPLEKIKDQLRSGLEGQKLGEAIEALLGQLRNTAEVVPAAPPTAPSETG